MATYTHRKGVGEASWYIGDDLQKHRRPIEIMRRCFVKKDTMAEHFNVFVISRCSFAVKRCTLTFGELRRILGVCVTMSSDG